MARHDDRDDAINDSAFWFSGVAARATGPNKIYGTAGSDDLTGTEGDDVFAVYQNLAGDGGNDTIYGLGGDDRFIFGATFTDADLVFGGAGKDRVIIQGTFDTDIILGPDNFNGVERVSLRSGLPSSDYKIVLLDGVEVRSVKGSATGTAYIDASEVTDHRVRLSGGLDDDTLISGQHGGTLYGGLGADTLLGGLGADTFLYRTSSDSISAIDLISAFGSDDEIFLDFFDFTGTFHIGRTDGRVGDVIARYDAQADLTVLRIYLDGDKQPDAFIHITGDVTDLTVILENHLVLA